MRQHYSTHEVAKLFDVVPMTILRWVERGDLKAFVTVGGHRRILRESVRERMEALGLAIPKELHPDARPTLLVVDDDELFLRSFQRALRPYASKIDLSMTSSGADALVRLGRDIPSTALVDLCLLDVDGVEVCRQVRGKAELTQVRLIAMTAHPGERRKQAALTAGAEQVLEKPFDVDALARQLLRGSARAGRRRAG